MGRWGDTVDSSELTSVIGATTYCIRSTTWLRRSPSAPLPAWSRRNRQDRAPLGSAAPARPDQLADPLHGRDMPVVVADGRHDAGRPGRRGNLRGLAYVPAYR